MKIFLLENEEYRIVAMHKFLREKYPNCEIFTAVSAEKAKKILQEKQPFDLLFLDHDLEADYTYSDYRTNNGLKVAEYIVENNIPYNSCYIHSVNWYGAEKMRKVLGSKSVETPITSLLNKSLTEMYRDFQFNTD